jgi:23S rRNA U2552 (ribose-2'-O)-methylase RlmE/FtsJ
MKYKNNLSYKAFIKSPFKSIKHSTYFDVYDELFSKYRNKKITFVEIGVLSGGSLFMWRNFFGSKARIIGIDLNPIAKKSRKHGFEIFIGDQSDKNFWKNLKKKTGQIDIILDDGGHRYIDQITTIECMLSNIKNNGMIVVEDSHTSYMKGFGNKKYSFINYIKKKIDKINYRFHRLKKDPEMMMWSLKVYESIVAIEVKNKKELTKSFSVKNRGVDDKAKDFRVERNIVYTNNHILNRIINKINILRLEIKTNSILKKFFN